jgi:hypothetical protein
MLKLTEFHPFVLAIITFVVVTVVYVLLVAMVKFKGNKFNQNTLTESSNKSRFMKKQSLMSYNERNPFSRYQRIIIYLLSTNHKDIGGAYMFLGGFAGMVHTAFSLYVRQDVTHPGNTFLLLLNQSTLYNVIITVHVCLMVFFIVQFILIALSKY